MFIHVSTRLTNEAMRLVIERRVVGDSSSDETVSHRTESPPIAAFHWRGGIFQKCIRYSERVFQQLPGSEES